jgi:hypothetical protein
MVTHLGTASIVGLLTLAVCGCGSADKAIAPGKIAYMFGICLNC